MKQSTARQHLQCMMIALQRYRSVAKEDFLQNPDKPEQLGLTEETMARLWPWVFGDKCPLLIISKLLDRPEGFTGMEYYNLMIVLTRLMPEVKVYIALAMGVDIPDPDITLAAGFEEE